MVLRFFERADAARTGTRHTVRRSDAEVRTGNPLGVNWSGHNRPITTTGFVEPFKGVDATTLASLHRARRRHRRSASRGGAPLCRWRRCRAQIRLLADGRLPPQLLGRWLDGERFLLEPAPTGVLVVARDDASHFIVNTTPEALSLRTRRHSVDRINGSHREITLAMAPFEVLWLE